MKLLGVLLAAAVLAPAASAEAVLRSDLSAKAAAVRGTPVTVYCETDQATWNYWVGEGAQGISSLEDQTIGLSPETCRWIDQPTVGNNYWVSLYVLLHEVMHTAGVSSEGGAECWSLFMLRYELRRWWGLSPADAERAYAAAWTAHRRLTGEYVGACQPEPDAVSPANGLRGS